MPSDRHTIIYTHTDEAPALATRSLLPVVNAFTDVAGRAGRAARHLARRPGPGRVPRGAHRRAAGAATTSPSSARWSNRPEANVIKLPNVSASIPQLKATIEELRAKGYMLPDYPDEPVDARGGRRPGPLRQGEGLGGQPGAARGQLRPPRAALGEELRPKSHPPQDGRVVARLEDPRRHHGRATTSAPTSSRSPSPPPTTCRSSSSARDGSDHRAQGVDPGARRRDRRRHVHERARRSTRSSPSRWPTPRRRTCCSRSTSRPR